MHQPRSPRRERLERDQALSPRRDFFDCALRGVEEHQEKVQYIDLNPVRAGPVKHAGEPAWLGAPDQFRGRATFFPLRFAQGRNDNVHKGLTRPAVTEKL